MVHAEQQFPEMLGIKVRAYRGRMAYDEERLMQSSRVQVRIYLVFGVWTEDKVATDLSSTVDWLYDTSAVDSWLDTVCPVA